MPGSLNKPILTKYLASLNGAPISLVLVLFLLLDLSSYVILTHKSTVLQISFNLDDF